VVFVSRDSELGFDLFVYFPITLPQITLGLVCSLERPCCFEFSPTTNYVSLYISLYERTVPSLFCYSSKMHYLQI